MKILTNLLCCLFCFFLSSSIMALTLSTEGFEPKNYGHILSINRSTHYPIYLQMNSVDIGIVKNCGGGDGKIILALEDTDGLAPEFKLDMESGIERGSINPTNAAILGSDRDKPLKFDVSTSWCPQIFITIRGKSRI